MSFFTFLWIKHGLAYIEGIIIYEVCWLFYTWYAFKSVIKISVLLEAVIYKKIRVISIMIFSCDIIKLLLQVNNRLLYWLIEYWWICAFANNHRAIYLSSSLLRSSFKELWECLIVIAVTLII